MMPALKYTIEFFLFPLFMGFIMYAIVHFQFLFLHKLLRVDFSQKTRIKINIATFILFFIITLILVITKEYASKKWL